MSIGALSPGLCPWSPFVHCVYCSFVWHYVPLNFYGLNFVTYVDDNTNYCLLSLHFSSFKDFSDVIFCLHHIDVWFASNRLLMNPLKLKSLYMVHAHVPFVLTLIFFAHVSHLLIPLMFLAFVFTVLCQWSSMFLKLIVRLFQLFVQFIALGNISRNDLHVCFSSLLFSLMLITAMWP